jgi:putative protease
MGRVVDVTPDGVTVEPGPANGISPLKAGDGIVFDAADWRSPQEPEEGGRIYEVAGKPGGKLELRFANQALNVNRIRGGDLVWRTHDPELDRVVRRRLESGAKQAVDVHVVAHEGEPLRIDWALQKRPSTQVTVSSPEPLTAARNRSVTEQFVREQLGRLGNTAYELGVLSCEFVGLPFVPASLLNQLRRQAVEQLESLQSQPRNVVTHIPPEPLAYARGSDAGHEAPRLHLLVRTPEQLDAAVACAPHSITLDYLDLYGLKPSVERVKAAGIPVRVASPRIQKPNEERIVDFLVRLDCPILVRSIGLLRTLKGRAVLTGDFSLNAANSLTADMLLELGLERITPTHDLNAGQIAALARMIGPGAVEAIAYQHLPVFHTEHCVFCRFLSQGISYKDCGRPCENHRVALRDTAGREHPVMADVGCRNTVFGAEAQEASLHLESWRQAGIANFRLEFVHESGEEAERITRLIGDTLAGRKSYAQLAQDLKRAAPQGTTEGSLFIPKDYLVLPILQ